MARKKISQVEARRLQRRVTELESEERSKTFGGVEIDEIDVKSEEWFILRTAARLGHVCIIRYGACNKANVYAVKR